MWCTSRPTSSCAVAPDGTRIRAIASPTVDVLSGLSVDTRGDRAAGHAGRKYRPAVKRYRRELRCRGSHGRREQRRRRADRAYRYRLRKGRRRHWHRLEGDDRNRQGVEGRPLGPHRARGESHAPGERRAGGRHSPASEPQNGGTRQVEITVNSERSVRLHERVFGLGYGQTSTVQNGQWAEPTNRTRTGDVFHDPYGLYWLAPGLRTSLTRDPLFGLLARPPWRTECGSLRFSFGAFTSVPCYRSFGFTPNRVEPIPSTDPIRSSGVSSWILPYRGIR